MKKQIINIISILALGFSLISCGSGSGGNDTSEIDSNFRDANVVGLGYKTSSKTSVTGKNGHLKCKKGESVDFFIGKLALGAAKCIEIITPAELNTVKGNSTATANIVRFLNAIDNGMVDGEVTISAATTTAFKDCNCTPTLSFKTDASFTASVTELKSFISISPAVTKLPSIASATAHINKTIQCAYSGAFSGISSVLIHGEDSEIFKLSGFINPKNGFIKLNFYNKGELVSYTKTMTNDVSEFSINPNNFILDDFTFKNKKNNTTETLTVNGEGVRLSGSGNVGAIYRFTGEMVLNNKHKAVFSFDVDKNNNVIVKVYDIADNRNITLLGKINGSNTMTVIATNYTATATIDLAAGTVSSTKFEQLSASDMTFTANGCQLNPK